MIPCTPSLCKILRNTRNHKLQLTNRTPVIFRHKATHTATRIRNSQTSSQLCCTTRDLADDIIHSCAILLCSRTVKQEMSQCFFCVRTHWTSTHSFITVLLTLKVMITPTILCSMGMHWQS